MYDQYVTLITLTNKFKPNLNLPIKNQISERSQNVFSQNNRKSYQCGTRFETKTTKATSLIVGGITADRYDFPWLVAQYHLGKQFICGGSLVSSKIVVTAAHCLREKRTIATRRPQDTTFLLGKYKLTDINEQGYIVSDVQRFEVHPNWNSFSETYDSDIGIAVLAKNIPFSDTIRSICVWPLGQNHYDVIGKPGIVAG